MKTLGKKLAKSKIFKELRDLEDVCDDKLIEILLELGRENHAIEL